jgi:predicted TIM-barrel fold metal-dependent hydrolase
MSAQPAITAHRIDTHHHIVPPRYLERRREEIHRIAHVHMPKMVEWTPTIALEAMDRAGIATAITSISSPGCWFGHAGESIEISRECNEYAARMASDYPGRFGNFAALPLPDVEGSLREIEYACDVLKVDGFGLMTNYGAMWPGDPALAPVFDELNRRKAVVYFHPHAADYCTGVMPELPAPTLEFPFDTTRAIASLLFSGTLGRCRDIRFIFSHAGGTLPMLAGRIAAIAGTRKELAASIPNGALHEFQRLYYDIVNATNPVSFNAARATFGVSQLLFGTDFPFWSPQIWVDQLAALELSPADLRAIERDNALRLLPRFGA